MYFKLMDKTYLVIVSIHVIVLFYFFIYLSFGIIFQHQLLIIYLTHNQVKSKISKIVIILIIIIIKLYRDQV